MNIEVIGGTILEATPYQSDGALRSSLLFIPITYKYFCLGERERERRETEGERERQRERMKERERERQRKKELLLRGMSRRSKNSILESVRLVLSFSSFLFPDKATAKPPKNNSFPSVVRATLL